MMMTSNTTQGTSTAQAITGTSFVADFNLSGNTAPSVHDAVTGSTTERIMIFRTANAHTFTVPAGGVKCDILMIGGGGSGDGGYRNGGGAGACIVAINQTLPAGLTYVVVGAGGANVSSGVKGSPSYISNPNYANPYIFLAEGGGRAPAAYDTAGGNGGCGGGAGYNLNSTAESGGVAESTNVVANNANIGPTGSTTNGLGYAVLGYPGGANNIAHWGGSGGGIGAAGTPGGAGGNGAYQVTINGTTYNFRTWFANGGNNFGVLSGGQYYIGGGGGGYDPTGPGTGSGGLGGASADGSNAIANTGSGASSNGGTGGSGIIIIRYLSNTTTTTYTHTPTSTTTLTTTLGTPSIELVRGTQGDSNTDYKIGNYNGDFKIMSSTSSIDTDRFNITTAGNIGIGITNPAVKLQVVGGDFACSGDISAYYSDERLKTRLSNIKDPLEIIGKLNGFYYIPNDLARFYGITNMAQEIGLSAQEVNKVLPELVKIAPFDLSRDEDNNKVSKSGENYLTLSYDRLAPVFVEAIKELRCSNDDLNEKYNRLLERFINDEKL